MDGAGDLAGEGSVSFASAGVREVLGFEGFDFGSRKEGKFTEIFADFDVLGVNEKLVEFVRAGFLGIEPDGAALGFTKFTAVGFGDEREGQAPSRESDFFADEIRASGDVAPLFRAANLEFAIEGLTEMAKVVGLEELVAELGETDAGLAAEAGFYAVLGDHAAEGEMFTHVAQEIEEADGSGPVSVVDDTGGIAGGAEIEETLQLSFNACEIVSELLARKQVALGGFAAGIADHAGGAAGEADGVMTGQLEAPQRELRDQMTDVEGIAGGVEAAIQGDRALVEALGQRI